jgi:Protein of unknown function (DUF3467)
MSEGIPNPPDMDGVPVVYTNLLRTTASPFEFALDFGYITAKAEPPSEPPEGQVRVVMTWEYAKLLRDLMQEVIETREGNVGEINRPPGIVLREGEET